jgi:predicted  nucleic acid-binding Zn-ribbon protein
VVQELPGVYRQKFAERIEPIKEKVEQLQKENRQLHAELQSVTYRLAMRNRKAQGLDLPTVGVDDDGQGIQMPSFGNV